MSFSQRDPNGSTLFAPGAYVSTVDALGQSVSMSGTSAAAPQVAAAVALAQQVARETLGRSLTPAEVRSLLADSGVVIRDGDDEQDNVANTGVTYRRLDLVALAEAVAAYQPGAVASPSPIAREPSPVQGTAVASGVGRTVLLGRGQTIKAVDLGLYREAELTGTIFDDRDGDGQLDAGEPPLGGIGLYLDLDGDGSRGVGEAAASTGADGTFAFAGLKPGEYTVRALLPADRLGTATRTLSLTSGQSGTANFGTTSADATPPTVTQFVVKDGQSSRSTLDRVAWVFSEALAQTAFAAGVALWNVTTGRSIALSEDQFRYDAASRTLTWSLNRFGTGSQSLADGRYEWTLDPATFADAAGNALAGLRVFSATRTTGDLSGDGAVTDTDVALVTAAVGTRAGMVNLNAAADLDGDGVVTARDRKAIAVLKATAPRVGVSTDTPLSTPVLPSTSPPARVVWSGTTPIGELTPARIVPPVAGNARVVLTTKDGQPLPSTAEVKNEIAGKSGIWLSIDAASLLEQTVTVDQPVTIRIRGIGSTPVLLRFEIIKKA